MTFDQIKEIYNRPLLELIYQSSDIHRKNHQAGEVQVCTLLSVKTGGCTEDCAYCPQAARYHTDVKVHKLLDPEDVLNRAKEAKANGSTRFCMGAAWREVRDNRDFDNVLAMVREVNKLDMEVCCTLGMLSASQAEKLKEAGLTAYNHNIDTSEEYYDKVITTRTYEDRLETIHNVSKAGISVCSGGIIGLGEEEDARIGMIYTLANLPEPPESIPVNALVPVKGTPLENMERVSVWEMLRMIATIRIVVPKAMIRLSAGRNEMPISEQALCFIAGANSIFAGDKLLTTPNPAFTSDMEMFEILGLQPRVSFKNENKNEVAEVL
ncbi:MAG TPA: biotin synthase BioB [Chitinophagales bacterium]|nr:biotin synthase BioB [Chitinophagales bacterium]HMV03717.1 biotin synthase BioB [Chitinophagales bacterium]HMY42248.1 biotin synthase BioB [Chitinophagales bacterium]HNC64697.1 biotin synthase BioB [Chitinophagales bacterium]HND45107.1 biotin synthase BioB [Chitinophagales bacterium]